jgi:serine/threonine protein kinase/outer membrane protein assembly factor BamB
MLRYIRQEEIGRGAFGVVYRALDTLTGDIVAIKVLTDSAGRPKREIFVSHRIAHPNVCRIFEHFEDEDGFNCIVMEHVDGGNLRTLIKTSAPLPLDRALSIAMQILDGLEALHEAGIVHRDLKPENILLTSSGTVKLTDFGHARPIGTTPSLETLREPGTLGYMAPEQALGEECDARADIFAFGRILKELLGNNEGPAYVQAAINGCREKEPALRFASAREVRHALRKPKLMALLAVSAITIVLAAIPVWYGRHHDSSAAGAFFDGSYFLQRGLAADALLRFDETVSMDPSYPGVQYYRGLALEKLNRLDEAIDAFKRALPRSEPERRILWSWDAPSTDAEHGIIRGMDNIQVNWQRDFIESRKDVVLQKGVIYGERNDKATVLHFLNLEQNRERRIEIPDEHVAFDTTAKANGLFTIVPAKNRFYGFSADGTLLWHKDLTGYGAGVPRSALIGETFYIYSPELKRFDLLDAQTGNLLWRKDDLSMGFLDPPVVRTTKAHGDLLIVKSGSSYRAIRKSDGKDAWIVATQSEKVTSLPNDTQLIVFEPERRIFTVDLETGKTVSELGLEQYVDALQVRPIGRKWLVGALLDGSTLYVMSEDLDLYAIDASPPGRGRCEAAGEGRRAGQTFRPSPCPLPEGEGLSVRWKTPILKRMQAIRAHGNHIYLGTNSGELIVMDASTGGIIKTTKLTAKPVLIDYAGDDAVLVGSNNTLYGLDPLGVKRWEYPSVDPLAAATYFNGTITAYTSPQQLSSLDVRSGNVLWQYTSTRRPYVFIDDGRFFIVEDRGVKEYAITPASHSVTDKETMTEIARAYQAKGDLEQTRVFVDKASEIDANYPPLELLRSRLSKAQGRADEAGRELAQYASLVGLDSKEGQRAISELKRDFGLLWLMRISPDVAGDPVFIEKRLVSVGRRVGHELAIVALDPQTGAVVWSYSGERYLASVAEPPFVWYVSSSQADETLINLYRIDVRSGERQLMESRHNAGRVDQAWIAYEAGHARIVTEPMPASEGKHIPLRNKLWEPSAYLVHDGRLYAYTPEGHAYAMRLN